MVFGKKNKNEIQYYVDQIDRLKEENAYLNTRISDQNAELEHYKAFFNSNSKLIEASNRMNIACGDIQDAFDNLVDHAEAIRFPDRNVNVAPITDDSINDNHDAITKEDLVQEASQDATSDRDTIVESFPEFLDETGDISSKDQASKSDIYDLNKPVTTKDRFTIDDVGHDDKNTSSGILERVPQDNVLLEEEPLFEIENTTGDIKSNNMISRGYATKSEMIAGHVDSLFAMDDQDNNKPELTQSDVIPEDDQLEKKEITFETDNLFDESEMTDKSKIAATNVDDYRTTQKTTYDTTVRTETELIDIKPVSSVNSETNTQSLSLNNHFNTSYDDELDTKGTSKSVNNGKSHVSANVEELFDEEFLDSDEIKPVIRKEKEDMNDLFLEEESLTDSQLTMKPDYDDTDVKPADELDDRLQDETNNYVFESTPKGQHIAFDEPIDNFSKPEDFNSSKETTGIFEIDDISDNNDTDSYTEASHFNKIKTNKSYTGVDNDPSPISEVRSRIASIDFHEEIAWIKPKRNPRKRKFSYLTKD